MQKRFKAIGPNGKVKKLYNIWIGMLRRCHNPTYYWYRIYGAKGIKVEFKDYFDFEDWALANGYQEGLSIDRIDSKKGYNPANCRWVTIGINSSNRGRPLTYMGVTYKNVRDASEQLNIRVRTITRALQHGSLQGFFIKYICDSQPELKSMEQNHLDLPAQNS